MDPGCAADHGERWGSSWRALLEHGLVDELRLMVHPVVLGAGARPFEGTGDRQPLRLLHALRVGDGLALLTYEVVR